MGDRGNIYVVEQTWIKQPEGAGPLWGPEPLEEAAKHGIYLYSHWAGTELPEELREALSTPQAKGRWSDQAYLWRIVVDQVFKRERDEETGAGISRSMPDNEHPITVLSLTTKEVAWARPGHEKDPTEWKHRKSFSDFVVGGPATYPEVL